MNKIIVAVTLLVILAAVNWAIWDKEGHLAEGEVMYLELAPVDPRSLMQGDYMALNFAHSNRIQSTLYQARADEDILKAWHCRCATRLKAYCSLSAAGEWRSTKRKRKTVGLSAAQWSSTLYHRCVLLSGRSRRTL